ncbi:hypothetical protein [Geodermatophilus obscurus]|uniref:hypothetical protein n=1 Tax=Geodermatophilus obscurus TaxID=1861 RepID=UPI00116031E7|nr:hypothetical protein [Geodermatophilus obscurus]
MSRRDQKRFLADVWTTVLANLVAASIIWLAGVAVGFVESRSSAVIGVTVAAAISVTFSGVPFIALAGFEYITAGGDEAKVTSAKGLALLAGGAVVLALAVVLFVALVKVFRPH